MTTPGAPSAIARSPSVALFDLDGTLTWRDTLLPFLCGFAARHPHRLPGLWRLPAALLRFLARGGDRGQLKASVIRMLMRGASRGSIDAWAETFVARLASRRRFRPAALAVLAAHRAAGDRLVLLSASPDLYVPRIGHLLGFELTLCTELQWRGERLEGSLKSANRHGAEKVRCLAWLRIRYPDMPVVAYGNSTGDLAHLRQADRANLVNGNATARHGAAEAGIAVTEWR